MLTSTQKGLVQDSFARFSPLIEDVAALFYRRLFELDPSLRGMFAESLVPQQRKLAQTLTAAVKGLDHVDQLIPVLQDLGRRHARYGVTDAHYDTVGTALLWTFQKVLGPAFTAEVEDAWTTVYGILASTMKHAARNEAAA
jgi:hemoglobin-like flavoprotein